MGGWLNVTVITGRGRGARMLVRGRCARGSSIRTPKPPWHITHYDTKRDAGVTPIEMTIALSALERRRAFTSTGTTRRTG